MKLTVLLDNQTLIDRYFWAEPALSFLLEEDDKRILFDVGYSEALIQNAWRMNINLRVLDWVVLSHGHLDHTWGLGSLLRLYAEAEFQQLAQRRPTMIAHPDVLRSRLIGSQEIGALVSEDKLSHHFQLSPSREPVWLTDKLLFLGEIPRRYDFEARDAIGEIDTPEGRRPDTLLDDSAIVFCSQKGLVIVVGCAHSGICNIVAYAQEITGIDHIVDIVGGLHLLDPSPEQLQGTLDMMAALKPDAIHACHCTDLRSKIALASVANVQEVGVGTKMIYL